MLKAYVHKNNFNSDIWLNKVGQAVTILLNSDRKSTSIASIGAFVLPFAKLGQLQTFEGYNGFPSAYITWGYLTEQSLHCLAKKPSSLLDIDELNAGDKLVIFDIISNLKNIKPILEHIKILASLKHPYFYGLRYDKKQEKLILRVYKNRYL